MDHQIKIRGHRVELGEIETLLNDHPNVRECVVVARESANGDKQLVAYVIPREGQNPTRRQLRQFMQERIPDHMMPAQFVFMTAFPHTPNKKIDRNALPAPDADAVESESDFEPPATVVEETLAALWGGLLGVQRVGRHDNFFESGGHSMLAMQLVSNVRDRFGVDDAAARKPLRAPADGHAGLAEAIDALSWSATLQPPAERAVDREEVEV